MDGIYTQRCKKKAHCIISDTRHPARTLLRHKPKSQKRLVPTCLPLFMCNKTGNVQYPWVSLLWCIYQIFIVIYNLYFCVHFFLLYLLILYSVCLWHKNFYVPQQVHKWQINLILSYQQGFSPPSPLQGRAKHMAQQSMWWKCR